MGAHDGFSAYVTLFKFVSRGGLEIDWVWPPAFHSAELIFCVTFGYVEDLMLGYDSGLEQDKRSRV